MLFEEKRGVRVERGRGYERTALTSRAHRRGEDSILFVIRRMLSRSLVICQAVGTPGQIDDLLPDGFDRFTLFIAGGKFTVDLLIDAGAQPGAPKNVRSRREVRDEEGRLLEFVTRLPTDGGENDRLSRPDCYLRCSECSVENDVVVAVADPEQECLCGALSRGSDGALNPVDESRYFTAVYRVAQS